MSCDKIVLLATHIIEDVATIAKEILFMNHGDILLRGDLDSLRQYYEAGKKAGRMTGVEMQDEIMILENLYYDLFHVQEKREKQRMFEPPVRELRG